MAWNTSLGRHMLKHLLDIYAYAVEFRCRQLGLKYVMQDVPDCIGCGLDTW